MSTGMAEATRTQWQYTTNKSAFLTWCSMQVVAHLISLAGVMHELRTRGVEPMPGSSGRPQQPCRVTVTTSPLGLPTAADAAYNWTTSDLVLLAGSNATVTHISQSPMCVTVIVLVSIPPVASDDMVGAGTGCDQSLLHSFVGSRKAGTPTIPELYMRPADVAMRAA
jgi:hypothetical protein